MADSKLPAGESLISASAPVAGAILAASRCRFTAEAPLHCIQTPEEVRYGLIQGSQPVSVGAAGGGKPGPFALVRCKEDGIGESGSLSSPCTWTYIIASATDTEFANPLATAVPVIFGRTSVGAYMRPADGSWGLAFTQPNPDDPAHPLWFLFLVQGEVPNVTGCNCA